MKLQNSNGIYNKYRYKDYKLNKINLIKKKRNILYIIIMLYIYNYINIS